MSEYDPQYVKPADPLKRRRGIYILPNLFTTASLFAGFYAIVQAMNGRYEYAAVAIFVAMVLDGLDGRVARLTHTQSAFGAEYDSLSDMVSFGAAPALIAYEWAMRGLGKWGWIAAFIYCAGAALRLARFNTNLGTVDMRWAAFAITLFAGLTMVSNVKFWSGKDINLRRSVPFIVVFGFVLAFVAVSLNPPIVLFGLFVAYALSGYVMLLAKFFTRKSTPPAA